MDTSEKFDKLLDALHCIRANLAFNTIKFKSCLFHECYSCRCNSVLNTLARTCSLLGSLTRTVVVCNFVAKEGQSGKEKKTFFQSKWPIFIYSFFFCSNQMFSLHLTGVRT